MRDCVLRNVVATETRNGEVVHFDEPVSLYEALVRAKAVEKDAKPQRAARKRAA